MKFLMIFLLTVVFVFAQAPDRRTYPMNWDAKYIFGSASAYGVLGANGDGADTSSVISTKDFNGAIVLYFLGDTTGASVAGANQSDSCLTILMQGKNKELNVWGGLYSETTSGYTKLDTVSRLYMNVAASTCPHLPLAEETAWCPHDSVRFIFQNGVGDSLNLKVVIDGQ